MGILTIRPQRGRGDYSPRFCSLIVTIIVITFASVPMIVAIIVIISVNSSPPFCIYDSVYAIFCQHFSHDLITIKCVYFNVSDKVHTTSHTILYTKKDRHISVTVAFFLFFFSRSKHNLIFHRRIMDALENRSGAGRDCP